jgi:hypothetical protein
MSAAATAAGYLYASGRLRGRGAKPGEPDQPKHEPKDEPRHEQRRRPAREEPTAPRREVRVAVYEPQEKPKRQPKIEYRTRRWRPGEESR